ncbi:MAG: preprotein translocase subunit SecG [Candidatus Aureabacteria bacterium]|nr:preprotein translocase subunit SecG [Candidatus Auribacterota bacterium]
MFTFLLSVHVLLCIALVIIVLLQAGKGQGLAGLFGAGGGTQTIFGSRAGDILTKFTTIVAILWMLISVSLAVMSSKRSGTFASKIEAEAAKTANEVPLQQDSQGE